MATDKNNWVLFHKQGVVRVEEKEETLDAGRDKAGAKNKGHFLKVYLCR
jgi:hypothetical protein